MSDPSNGVGNGYSTGGDAVGAKIDEGARRVGRAAHQVSDAGYQAYDKLRDSAADLYSAARRRADQAAADAQGYLREQPVVAVGAGVLIGLTLGLLLTGRTTVYVREGRGARHGSRP